MCIRDRFLRAWPPWPARSARRWTPSPRAQPAPTAAHWGPLTRRRARARAQPTRAEAPRQPP
eukprot:11883208-Alexandrium_andersonii.AAC.1